MSSTAIPGRQQRVTSQFRNRISHRLSPNRTSFLARGIKTCPSLQHLCLTCDQTRMCFDMLTDAAVDSPPGITAPGSGDGGSVRRGASPRWPKGAALSTVTPSHPCLRPLDDEDTMASKTANSRKGVSLTCQACRGSGCVSLHVARDVNGTGRRPAGNG